MTQAALEDAAGYNLPDNVPAECVVDFDLYNLEGTEIDFDEPWRRLKEAARKCYGDEPPGLLWTPRNEGHWIAIRGAHVAEVLEDSTRFSNTIIFVPKTVGIQHHMLPTNIDVPDHQAYRRLINPGMSPRSVRALSGVIRDLSISLIEAFEKRGECDFAQEYAAKLPVVMFMRLVDLPVEDAEQMKHWANQILHADGEMNYAQARALFETYLTPYIEARLKKPGSDMLSHVIHGDINGRPLSREEMLKFCMQLMLAGLDTVINLLNFIFLFLARNPGHRRQLTENPSSIGRAQEELFRRFSIVSTARAVTHDLDYGSVRLKQGDMVLAPTPFVSTDEELYPDPFTVDFNRRQGFAHAEFGRGPHICAGANLARAEIAITLEEWLKRIPEFELVPDTQIVFNGGIVGTIDSLPLRWKVG
jgi:cytochrome P450